MISNLLQNWPALLILFAGVAGAVGVYVSVAEQYRLQTKLPALLVLVAGIAGAVGVYVSAAEQDQLQTELIEKTAEIKKVQKRNIELTEDNAKISKNLLHQVTGGDSIPYIEFIGNGFFLRHQSGSFPLFNLRISIQEVWWPLAGEKTPSTFWTKQKFPISLNKDIIVTPHRNLISFETPLLLPNRSIFLKGYNFDFEKTLFPETKKCYFSIQISARNGYFTQYIACRKTSQKIKGEKKYIIEISTLLLNEDGKKILGNGDWIKGEPILYPDNNTSYSNDLMLRVWP